MKLRLTITLISLLVVAMLLTNLVMFFLWKRDALQREVRNDQAVLAHIQSLLLQEKKESSDRVTQEFSFSDFYAPSERGRFFLLLQSESESESESESVAEQGMKKARVISEESQITTLLIAVAQEARSSGQPVSRTAVAFPHVFSWNDLLLNAQPIFSQKEVIGAVAVVRSLDGLFLTLWQNEKTLLIYLLVNVLVLGAIGFFRMVNLVIRPVDRLVALADQYSHQDPFQFVTEKSGSEFGNLSKSLNSMLSRIEEDRQVLQRTVTALESANKTLRKQQQEMVRTEKLATVGRMAAGLAHEIGNPLSVVQGYLGILLASKDQSEEHKDFLCRSEQEVHRIDTLIRQLLNFSRASKGKPSFFSVHELLFSILEMVKVQTAFRNIVVATDFAAQEDRLYADSEQLRQVFVNCLLNSADAIRMTLQEDKGTRKKNGRITVSTAVQCLQPNNQEENGPAQLLVCISDNGGGIATEDLSLVFDPFFTTKEPGKGTGLGLSVSRSLVEAAGGTMELQTEIGQGSNMLVHFPLSFLSEEEVLV